LLLFRGGQLIGALNELGQAMTALGRADLNRARSTAELIQINEGKVLAKLFAVEGVLVDEDQRRGVGVIHSGGISQPYSIRRRQR
jgi:hypothetical protein